MENVKSFKLGEVSSYLGKHREFGSTDRGIGLIPLGDRYRAIMGPDALEERESVVLYDKFLGKIK